VRGVLSTITSNWVAAGTNVGRLAHECSPEEIREQLWQQLHAYRPALSAGGLVD
jgi:hypothetical protein